MKQSNFILVVLGIMVISSFTDLYLGRNNDLALVHYCILTAAYAIVKELEKLNGTKSRKKSDEFAKNFGDWLKYESVCFPEHKDKSIEELLEIYKK